MKINTTEIKPTLTIRNILTETIVLLIYHYITISLYHPSGGGWNSGAYLSIPDESVIVVRRNGTGSNSLSVFLNGGLVYQVQYTETFNGATPGKIRLGQYNRYSNYYGQTPLYMGIAAVAAWSSYVNDDNLRKYVNYQSLTTKS